jgi:glycosyltransferase involved in cell wall biosynthesis
VNVLMLLANPFTNDARVYAEAKSLVQAGHKVAVVAWDREGGNPARQTWDGIDVIRLKTRLPAGHGAAPWLLNGVRLLRWEWQAYRRALGLSREVHLDVIHCHDLDTLPVGVRLKHKLGSPLVYDAHEIYGYMIAGAVPGWMAGILLRLEKRLVSRVDRIITISEGRKRYLDGITDKPISIIMNCKPLQSTEYEAPDSRGDFTILYIGVLYEERAIPMLIRAAKDLPEVRCLIGGIGDPAYVEAIKEQCSRTSNVAFLGKIPLDEVIPMTKKADCVFWMLASENINNITGLGNKQFEAMVCGRPIICTKGTYSGEFTEREEIGLAVQHNKVALRQAIIKLRDDPALRERLGRNALKAAVTKYNWGNEEAKLLELYRGIEGDRRSSP